MRRKMRMKILQRSLLSAIVAVSSCAMVMAQGPPPGGPAGAKGPGGPGGPGGGRGRVPARPALSVTTTAFPDGGEIPMHNAGVGDNKSPAFEFHWNMGVNPGTAPDALKTYAVILHDVENVGPMNT